MLTGLGLRNFKAFGDEMQEAPLSKITLIYGPNSGGKSSIIQALLLLKQSLKNNYLEGGDHDIKRELVPRDELVDLGSFQSLLHKHDMERELELSVTYRNSDQGADSVLNDVHLTFSELGGSGSLAKVCYRIHSHENGNRRIFLDALLERSSENRITQYEGYSYSGRFPSEWNTDYTILGTSNQKVSYHALMDFLPTLYFPELKRLREQEVVLVEEKQRSLTNQLEEKSDRSAILPSLERRYMLQAREFRLNEAVREADWGFEWDKRLDRTQDELFERAIEQVGLTPEQVEILTPENIPDDYRLHLSLVNYLGPLRSAPQRLYRVFSVEDIDTTLLPAFHLTGLLMDIHYSAVLNSSSNITGIQGEFSANVLHHNNRIKSDVNNWFKRFKIPYELEAVKLNEVPFAGEHIAIALYLLNNEGDRLKNSSDEDVAVTLADVGYGINQLLPIIVEGIASQPDAILCVEQPEIHLHPRLQANIADLMIDTIVNEPGKRKQWIVETHSELLILRLQRRIREGKIKPEDISVLYVDPNDESTEGSAIIPLRMDENGDFVDEWPDGFFDESFNELMAEPERQLHPAD